MGLKRARLATLESFIIDTFTCVDKDGKERPVDKPDQIGGAGTYAIIGTRMFLPPSRLAMIVDYTADTLPASMHQTLLAFGKDMWEFRARDDGNGTTRAVNKYMGQLRAFEYLTPPKLLTPRSLMGTAFTDPLPGWIHLVSFPSRAEQALLEISQINEEVDGGWSPGFLWEPEPPCCIPKNLDVIARVTLQVDVISPNHTEAFSLFNTRSPKPDDLIHALEWATRRLVALRPRAGAILRCGPLGCCYALTKDVRNSPDLDPHSLRPPHVPVYWSPPFWIEGVPGYDKAIVDPTGCGNAFMGGLMAALDEGKDMDEAVMWANVAASFVIQQDGLPTMTKVLGREVWNGDYPWERVEALQRRGPYLPGGTASLGS